MGLFFNFSVALFSALGSFLFGYDSGIIGSVVSKNFDQFQLFFHNPSDNITGAIVSTVRYLPRSSTALISPATLVRRRMLLRRRSRGLARLSHWTQTHHTARRARCVSGMQPAEFLRSDAQWRVPLAIQIAPALLLFLGMFVLPYSPRWLVDQDRIDEAHKVVQQLHESSHNKEFVDLEFAEMLEQIRYEQTHYSTKFSDLWATTPMLRRTLTGMAVQICTQFTGINVASYFQPTLFANLGLSGPRILLLTGINGALGAVVILIFIYFIIDRVGRKPPLIIGALGMALCLAIEAAINAKWGGADANNPVAQKTGVAFIFLRPDFLGVPERNIPNAHPCSWHRRLHLRQLGMQRPDFAGLPSRNESFEIQVLHPLCMHKRRQCANCPLLFPGNQGEEPRGNGRGLWRPSDSTCPGDKAGPQCRC